MVSPPKSPYLAFEPDYASAPGELLETVLRTQGLSQADLAERTGLSAKYLNQIIKRNASVSADTAVLFEAVTGVPADLWARLEADHRSSQAKAEREELLPRVGSVA